MSRHTPGGSVIVVTHDAMRAARVEAALHRLAGGRIHVCTPRHLRALADENPGAVIATILTEVETRRMLRAIGAWPRSLPVIVLSDAPTRFWTSAFRSLGLRAVLPASSTDEEIAAVVGAVRAGLFVIHPRVLTPSLAWRDGRRVRRATDVARARDPRANGRWSPQPGHRRSPRHLAAHREVSRRLHPREARRGESHRGGDAGAASGTARGVGLDRPQLEDGSYRQGHRDGLVIPLDQARSAA